MSTIISQKNILGLNKDMPFSSKVISRKLLSMKGSTKATYHIKMDLSEFKNHFNEGDAFGVFPKNPIQEVETLLNLLGFDKEASILHPKTKKNLLLLDYLRSNVNLNKIHTKLLEAINDHASSNIEILQKLLDPSMKEQKKQFLCSNDVMSCLELFKPKNLPPQNFCNSCLPMLPRFYSCASSFDQSDNSVDFLISTFEYEVQNHLKVGVGSDYLCHRAVVEEDSIPMYLQKNEKFQLPKDNSIPIIMVGPGTGVAPFRAFIQKRTLQNASKNWLFFGERHQKFDFYYENEWQKLQKQNLLTLSVAFSRDQAKKVYVQDVLFESRLKLLNWLNEGAIVYVCGDAKSMEKDVRNTLISIFEKELQLTPDEAKRYFKDLKAQKRYLTDVY